MTVPLEALKVTPPTEVPASTPAEPLACRVTTAVLVPSILLGPTVRTECVPKAVPAEVKIGRCLHLNPFISASTSYRAFDHRGLPIRLPN